jgi:hypothetical protein
MAEVPKDETSVSSAFFIELIQFNKRKGVIKMRKFVSHIDVFENLLAGAFVISFLLIQINELTLLC